METKLHIPKNLYEPFCRLIKLIPAPYRNDKHVHQTILGYLEFKGEKFVRDAIKRTRDNYYSEFRDKTSRKQIKS